MKNLIFTLAFLIIGTSVFSQKNQQRSNQTLPYDYASTVTDKEREANLTFLSIDIERSVNHSKLTTTQKENRVLKLISTYMEQYASYTSQNDLIQMNICLLDGSCSEGKIYSYLWTIQEFDERNISTEQINTLGDIKTDKNLQIAMQLYQAIGKAHFGNSQLCKTGNCDKNESKRVRTRGADVQVWMYTGTKKFFTSEEVRGWRYQCRLMNPKQPVREENISSELNNESVMNTDMPLLITEWKKEEHVDRWR